MSATTTTTSYRLRCVLIIWCAPRRRSSSSSSRGRSSVVTVRRQRTMTVVNCYSRPSPIFSEQMCRPSVRRSETYAGRGLGFASSQYPHDTNAHRVCCCSRIVDGTDRQTDTRTLFYAFRHGRGQRDDTGTIPTPACDISYTQVIAILKLNPSLLPL